LNEVLLTVSGVIDPDLDQKIAAGERPQADYLALARAFGADLIDYGAARRLGGRLGGLIEALAGPNLLLAWVCWRLRMRYRAIFSDGEQVGLPLASLLKFASGQKRLRHLMIAHLISASKKTILLDLFRLFSHIDVFFVYSSWQKRFIEERWKVPPERVVFTPFMVDADFFSPDAQDFSRQRSEAIAPVLKGRREALICSVGLEFRDYPTLLEAVKGLDLDVVIAAASPWSRRPDTTAGREIPENVVVQRFSQYELRELYAASRFMVMPLYPVDFQAGVTALLEAMAMGKAVICSRTPGQTDVVVEGVSGLYVPPGDPAALRGAITWLMDHPEEAERMGKNGRQEVLKSASLDCYQERLASYVRG
jgi:glycosyltransferase involved in cell wall biosynthesis